MKGAGNMYAADWSPDGRFLLYSQLSEATGSDLWTLPLSGERAPVVYLQTSSNERSGTFSPDGRWVAYESDASGRTEIYVSAFPVAQEQIPVSREGGRAPVWNADEQRALFPDARRQVNGSTGRGRQGVQSSCSKSALPDPDRHVRQLPPIRRCEGRPAVSDSSPARGARLDADHRHLELASNSAEVTKGASHGRIALQTLTLSAS